MAASLIALTSLVSNEVLAQETPSPVITKAPELLEFVEPAYPVELTDVAGEVVLMIEIDAAGAVVAADVIRSSDARFEAPAIDAARRFEFSPAEIDGEPASVRIEYAIQFQPSVDESLVEPDSSAPDVVPEEPPVVIEGRILEAGNRRPVTGAEIVVDETMFTESRDGGRFEIRGAPVGRLRVRVSHPSFTAFEVMENRLESEKLVVTYYLRRDSNDPFETVVRSKTPRREVARVELSRAEVSRVPGTFGDPIRVIENLPGLARAPGGVGGALIVRGANPDDTGVYVDGVEIPLLYHFGGLTSVIPPDVLENIQFYPSGFSAKYSRATAGIVDVTTRDLDCETLRLNVEIDFI
ncbi:MAG: TonB family protein, partial [Myxococcota bacterium]